ncbi:uncharacterized protein L203_101912 [Cryptococcus depauperatus CBS 7841]|uniref:Ras family, other n=1 Tax=Cryptococcus depauperatus CBS 7841 TaxID=1295531 RepID=A0AAJ8LYW7_9TREE
MSLSPLLFTSSSLSRSVNLPALIPHTLTYRQHQLQFSEPPTPDTPVTPINEYCVSGNLHCICRLTSHPNVLRQPLVGPCFDSLLIMPPAYNLNELAIMSATGPLKRKVVIMGSTSVGKTSLTQQYVAPPSYTPSYYPTIEDTSHKIAKYNGNEYDIEIVDSAGLEEYSLFPGKYAVGVHGYMLVYSISSRQSFDMIPTIHDKILDYAGLENMPLVIVGQKTDLRDERSVTREEGEALAKKLKAGFVESSAKDNNNVSAAFETLLEEMQKVYNPQPEKKKSGWWPF